MIYRRILGKHLIGLQKYYATCKHCKAKRLEIGLNLSEAVVIQAIAMC